MHIYIMYICYIYIYIQSFPSGRLQSPGRPRIPVLALAKSTVDTDRGFWGFMTPKTMDVIARTMVDLMVHIYMDVILLVKHGKTIQVDM